MTTSTTTATFSQQVSISQAQPRQQFCRHSSDNKFCRRNWDNNFAGTTPTTVLQTQLRYNNPGSELAIDNGENPTTTRRTTWRKGQHQHRDWQRLAWAHLRFATSMASLDASWSTQFGKCFYNNVFIDDLVGDIEIHNHNLRLSMSLNKRDAPTHRQHQWWAPKTSESNRGCITQQFSAEFFGNNQLRRS